jgi:hypothetical protein
MTTQLISIRKAVKIVDRINAILDRIIDGPCQERVIVCVLSFAAGFFGKVIIDIINR